MQAGLEDCLMAASDFPHPEDPSFPKMIDKFFDEFGAAEDVDNVDFLRHIRQRRVAFLAERLLNLRIDGNNSIARRLKISGNSVAGTERVIGKPNDGNRLRLLKNFGDWIRLN